jgi:predicted RecB family endonuclease
LWAVEIKTGEIHAHDLRGLAEFTRRFPKYTPLVVCDNAARTSAARLGMECIDWQQFLVTGLSSRS